MRCGGQSESFGEPDQRCLGHRGGSQHRPRGCAGRAGHVHNTGVTTRDQIVHNRLIADECPARTHLDALEATQRAMINTQGALKQLETTEGRQGNQHKIDELSEALGGECVQNAYSRGVEKLLSGR